MVALYLLFLGLCVGGVVAWTQMRRRARARILASRLPPETRRALRQEVPILDRIPAALWPALEGKVTLFLEQVEFHGAEGLEITDAMRLSIAGQACLLVVGNDQWFETLRTIIVYPGAFRARMQERSGFVVAEREQIRLGESWPRGPVVLSWAHSERGAADPEDGQNVVLHEFAHQLDTLSGATDGAPVMNAGQSFEDWRRVFLAAFAQHQADVARGRRTVLDPYGAQSHPEFLAVAVEVFFEKPSKLQAEWPDVYGQLAALLGLDPAAW